MKIDAKYFTKENSKKLLNEIFLSIKSNNKVGLSNDQTYKNKSDKEIHEIVTYPININTNDKDSIRSFSLTIKRWDTIRWFKLVPKFLLSIKTEARSYGNNYEIEIDDEQELINEIYHYLIDIEENKNKEDANKKLSSIIEDISTTVDRSHRRDETLDEILN